MNLQSMEYLVEISDCGSISAAAKRLDVTQPYLSKVLRETEKEYGFMIFTRGKNGIVPTETGRLFLDMSRDLLDHANHFRETFREHSDSLRLRISASGCSHANDAFIRMISTHADTPFRSFYREMTSTEVIEDLCTNRSDIGFIMYPSNRTEKIRELLTLRHLEEHPLFRSPIRFFCRTGHPVLAEPDDLSPDKLYQYNFVLYPNESLRANAPESVYDDEMLQLINRNRISQIVYVNSRASLYDLIHRTDYLGIGITPGREQEKNYSIVSFPLPDWMKRGDGHGSDYVSSYIFRKGEQLPKAAEMYISALEDQKSSQRDHF